MIEKWNIEEKIFALAEEQYGSSKYAAIWGTAFVFLTVEQLEKIASTLEAINEKRI
jgi:uncharacterized protein (DUF169 family)